MEAGVPTWRRELEDRGGRRGVCIDAGDPELRPLGGPYQRRHYWNVPILKLDNCALFTGLNQRQIELALLGPGCAALPSDRNVAHSTVRDIGSRTGLRTFLVTQAYSLNLKKVINRLTRNKAVNRRCLQEEMVRTIERTLREVGTALKWPATELSNEAMLLLDLLSKQRELRHATESVLGSIEETSGFKQTA